MVYTNISEIKLDTKKWPRVKLDTTTVERYLKLYASGKLLPPLIINKDRYLIDGWHRYTALKHLGYLEIDVRMGDISTDEILLESVNINLKHGLQLSEEDKRDAIKRLRFEEQYSLKKIASAIGLSYSRVNDICKELRICYPTIDPDNLDLRRRRVKKIKRRQKRRGPYEKDRVLPVKLQIRNAKARFLKLNPKRDLSEVDWEDIFDPLSDYESNIHDIAEGYPAFIWLTEEEKSGTHLVNEPDWSRQNRYPLKLKLTQTASKWFYRATVYKKDHPYLRGRLPNEITISLPIDAITDLDYFDRYTPGPEEVTKEELQEQHEIYLGSLFEDEDSPPIERVVESETREPRLPTDILLEICEEEDRQTPQDIKFNQHQS